MVTVDPRFPHLLKDLRHDRGLSLRELATRMHYSHTYLWDIEIGRKQPTSEFAHAIDTALSAGGMLAELVAEDAEDEPADCTPLTAAMQVIDANRAQVADIARLSWSAPGDIQARAEAAQWTQFARWLYDTFVSNRPALRRLGAQRYSRRMREDTGASPFRIEVSRQGRTPHAECRSVTQQPAPPDVADRLLIDPHTVVICRENRYYADDEPVQNGTTYIPIGVAGSDSHVTTKALGRGSLYSRFEELGYDVARIREQVTTRLPTPTESASLKIPPGVPVLEIMHTSYDKQDRPFEVTCFTIRADLTVLDYEMTVDG
ncbi:UTRA domain-containing protein [Actinoplanes sp. NPDC051470]|uniref:UTRA domain-containing protein n=1 Tax=Actinoplanes sp. NPDC051470 TaxID=3157224 RepID=UPI00344033CD